MDLQLISEVLGVILLVSVILLLAERTVLKRALKKALLKPPEPEPEYKKPNCSTILERYTYERLEFTIEQTVTGYENLKEEFSKREIAKAIAEILQKNGLITYTLEGGEYGKKETIKGVLIIYKRLEK